MYRFSVHARNLEFWRENIFRHILGLKELILTKWMLISGTPLMKENVKLFTQSFGISLNYDLYRFNLKNEPSCICEFECENCYYFLWNVLYIILEAFICNSKKLWRDRFEYQFIWEYRTFNIS